MNGENHNETLDLFNKLNELPAPKLDTPDPRDQAPDGQCRCACGKKFIDLVDIRYHQTGVIIASDIQCAECYLPCRDYALVVCLECRAVVAKMAPTRFDGGFTLRSRFCYHVAYCPTCRPNAQSSFLVEKYQYDKAQGLPVPPIEQVLGTALPKAQVGIQIREEKL